MIISISGKIKSGKDTVAQMIQLLSENYNDSDIISILEKKLPEWRDETQDRQWEIKKFAFKVKEVASILTGIPVEDFEKQEVKDSRLPEKWHQFDENNHYLEPDTVRELLQRIGTECIREQLHPDAWINALFVDYGIKDLGHHQAYPQNYDLPNWIITDTRFPNEVKAVKERGGITIRINRFTGNHLIDNDTHAVTDWQHSSETALDSYKDWNYTIDNDSDLESLFKKVKEIYNQIKQNK